MKNTWPDGRPKVWFELYNEKCDLDATSTLTQAVKKALTWTRKFGVNNLAIYEVHSMGGWKSPKDDKITKVYKVVGKKAVQRHFVKGW